ncbi:MAG: FAD-dependent oxidoreductase [bacterium]
MQDKADAVVVGGGIIGVSVAYYLARANVGKVVLVEKQPLLGAEATSKAAGGIRAQFSTKVNIEMSMLSEKIFANFREETGHEALFDQVGYLFLLHDQSDIDAFEQGLVLQQSLGLNVARLQPDEIGQYAPHVDLTGVRLATFCPADGLGDPHEFLTGYEKGARRLGADITVDTEVTGIETSSGKISKVLTTRGEIATPLVVNCAGPFAKLIGAMVGAEVMIEPVRRQIVTTAPMDFVKPTFPMVVCVRSGLYCHKESGGMLLGWADKNVAPSFDISIDPDYTDTILEKALELIPQLGEAEVSNQWAGLYEDTPDHHAIIGWEPTVRGLFHCAGFSGHGFMHAPAAGIVTADIISGREPTIDISPLSPERFVLGKVVKENNVI